MGPKIDHDPVNGIILFKKDAQPGKFSIFSNNFDTWIFVAINC